MSRCGRRFAERTRSRAQTRCDTVIVSGTCGGCARPLSESALRCMYCGAAKAPPKACPKCKRKLDAFAHRCVFCNVDLDAPVITGPDPRAVTLARREIYNHAERLRRSGQIGAALALLDQALIADPKFVPAWIARGKCFAAASDWIAARDSAKAALATSARGHIPLGRSSTVRSACHLGTRTRRPRSGSRASRSSRRLAIRDRPSRARPRQWASAD
jgi:hypothetical protein